MQTSQSGKTIVIVAYKRKPGKEANLLQLTREHVPLLRAEGLATGHPVTSCQAKDGTVVEVFEWAAGGVERLRRRLRLRASDLAVRILHAIRILHPARSLSKKPLLRHNAHAPLRRPPAAIVVLRQQRVAAPALPQTVPPAGSIDHLRQPRAVRFAGKVRMSKAPVIVGLKGREVLTNEAQISRTRARLEKQWMRRKKTRPHGRGATGQTVQRLFVIGYSRQQR